MIAIELNLLAAAALLGLAQVLLTGAVRTRAYGRDWNVGARDTTPVDRKTPLVGRLERAQANFFETFPLFVAVVLAAAVSGRLGGRVTTGAWLYLVGRIVYVPLYAAGVPIIRTVVWGAATVGILLIARAVLA